MKGPIGQVGSTAGEIWHLLEKKGEASLNDIKNELRTTPSMVQMGVGWLAREGKVSIAKKGAGYLVSISR